MKGDRDMVYSDLVKKACMMSFEAHKDDHDKGGYPYVYHPFYLASQFDDENCVCAALLHDVIEDHGDRFSFQSLKDDGFGDEIIDALRLLTHQKGADYMEYVKAIAGNPIARKIKMADLRHNMDSSRTGGKLPPKIETYKEAYRFLAAIEEEK